MLNKAGLVEKVRVNWTEPGFGPRKIFPKITLTLTSTAADLSIAIAVTEYIYLSTAIHDNFKDDFLADSYESHSTFC